MGCVRESDCYFFEECVAHPTGICPGSCEVSTWFVYIVGGACIAALFVVYFCLRCQLCPTSPPPGNLVLPCCGADYNLFQPSRSKAEANAASAAVAAAAAAGGVAGPSTDYYGRSMSTADGGGGRPSIGLHQVVLLRSLSQEEY